MLTNTDTLSNPLGRLVLLTGAGFTESFGGYLGSEMWAAILNQEEVARHNSLRAALLKEFNFETVYDDVMTSGRYSHDEQQALKRALEKTYREMHEAIFSNGKQGSTFCQAFIGHLGAYGGVRCFLFTTNQDVFLERAHPSPNTEALKLPGPMSWFSRFFGSQVSNDHLVTLPDAPTVESYAMSLWTRTYPQWFRQILYVKLHGSWDWRTSDGQMVMAIGHSKTSIIQREPLLRWYFSLFEEVLHAPGRVLLVIGYGFGDPHINDVIAGAVLTSGLRLCIICPMQPREFADFLQSKHRGGELWSGLAGYYPARSGDLFSDEGRPTPVSSSLIRTLNAALA